MISGGFTDDVITLCKITTAGPALMRLAFSAIEDDGGTLEDKAAGMRSAFIASLREEAKKSHPFIQQIAARALLDHVDWKQVVLAVATDESQN